MPTDTRFTDFFILQAQNAGFFLGQLPNPATGRTQVRVTSEVVSTAL